MSWNVKYRQQFYDIKGIPWKIEIEQEASVNSVGTLIGSGYPLSFEWNNQSDDIFDPIKTSKANITFVANTNFQYSDLYATDDMQYRVSIYDSSLLFWRGYIVTNDYTETYGPPPYYVNIKAHCGLDVLKNMEYEPSIGRKLESQILLDVLGKVGVTQFTEYVNIYEDSMDSTLSDSPFDQVLIDDEVFKDKFCYDVVAEILKKYNACINQKNGTYHIYRPIDLSDTSIYGRIFTDPSSKTNTSYNTLQYINRPSNNSNLQQVPGGVMMIQSPAKKIKIDQDYSGRESWINNYDFNINSFHIDSSVPIGKAGGFNTYTVDYWTFDDTSARGFFKPFQHKINSEKDGILFKCGNNYPSKDYYLWQTFGEYAVLSTSDILNLEFDYRFINETAAQIGGVAFYIRVQSTEAPFYLSEINENECEWVAAPTDITITEDVPVGDTGWKTYKRFIEGLPQNGAYKIKIYMLDESYGDLYLGIKDVYFNCSQDSITRTKFRVTNDDWWSWLGTSTTEGVAGKYLDIVETNQKEYEFINDNNGTILSYNNLLGDVTDASIDNVLQQFKGSIGYAGTNLTKICSNFVRDNSASFLSGNVNVSSSSNILTFESTIAGVAFTGSTAFLVGYGDIDGSVVNFRANAAVQAQIDTLTLTGTGGEAFIICDGSIKNAVYTSNLTQTAADFASSFAPYYLTGDVSLKSMGTALVFTSTIPGQPFNGSTGISNDLPDLDGTVVNTQANSVGQKQRDDIYITGTTGNGLIYCDGKYKAISIGPEYTTKWNRRDVSENITLMEIIGNEIAEQYSRPKQLIQMPIQYLGSSDLSINLLGSFQDSLNQCASVNRKFVFNRGNYDVLYRKWDIDLCEII